MNTFNLSSESVLREVLDSQLFKGSINQTVIKDSLLEHKGTIAGTFVIVFLVHFIWSFFTVPSHLRHLPCVPIFALLKSYLSGEVEDARIKRLILPFANEKGEGVVLVWALGRWMVHILDEKVCISSVRILTNIYLLFCSWHRK
jgi:hypothetical protein